MPTREPSMTAAGTAPASRLRVLVVSHVLDPQPFRINQVVADLVVAGADAPVLTGQPNSPEGRGYPGYFAHRSGLPGPPGGPAYARVLIQPGADGGGRVTGSHESSLQY